MIGLGRHAALLRQCERNLRHQRPPNLSRRQVLLAARQALDDLHAAGYWLPPGPTRAQLASAAITEMQAQHREAWVRWAEQPQRRTKGWRSAVPNWLAKLQRALRRGESTPHLTFD